MQKAPFGYKVDYNEYLERYVYVLDEARDYPWYHLGVFFRFVIRYESIDEVIEHLLAEEIKSPEGNPYTRDFIIRTVSDPFYINLINKEMEGEKRYVVDLFESVITVQEWVLAQIALGNRETLSHPDVMSHIFNNNYNQQALNEAIFDGTDSGNYSLKYQDGIFKY